MDHAYEATGHRCLTQDGDWISTGSTFVDEVFASLILQILSLLGVDVKICYTAIIGIGFTRWIKHMGGSNYASFSLSITVGWSNKWKKSCTLDEIAKMGFLGQVAVLLMKLTGNSCVGANYGSNTGVICKNGFTKTQGGVNFSANYNCGSHGGIKRFTRGGHSSGCKYPVVAGTGGQGSPWFASWNNSSPSTGRKLSGGCNSHDFYRNPTSCPACDKICSWLAWLNCSQSSATLEFGFDLSIASAGLNFTVSIKVSVTFALATIATSTSSSSDLSITFGIEGCLEVKWGVEGMPGKLKDIAQKVWNWTKMSGNFNHKFSFSLGKLCISYSSTSTRFAITYDWADPLLGILNTEQNIGLSLGMPSVEDKCVNLPQWLKDARDNWIVENILDFIGITIKDKYCILADIVGPLLGIDFSSSTKNVGVTGSFVLGKWNFAFELGARTVWYIRKFHNRECCSDKGYVSVSKVYDGKTYTGVCKDWQVYTRYIRAFANIGLKLCYSGTLLDWDMCRVVDDIDRGCKNWDTGSDDWTDSKWVAWTTDRTTGYSNVGSERAKGDWSDRRARYKGDNDTSKARDRVGWASFHKRDWKDNSDHVCTMGHSQRFWRESNYHCNWQGVGDINPYAKGRRARAAEVDVPFVGDVCFWPIVEFTCTSHGSTEVGRMIMEGVSNLIIGFINTIVKAARALGAPGSKYFECFGPLLHENFGTRSMKTCGSGWSDVFMFYIELFSMQNGFKGISDGGKLDHDGQFKGMCFVRNINDMKILYANTGNAPRVYKCLNQHCNSGGFIGTRAWSYYWVTGSSSGSHSWASYDPYDPSK